MKKSFPPFFLLERKRKRREEKKVHSLSLQASNKHHDAAPGGVLSAARRGRRPGEERVLQRFCSRERKREINDATTPLRLTTPTAAWR